MQRDTNSNNTNIYKLRMVLKHYCDGRHTQCTEYLTKYINNIDSNELDQEFVTKYITHITRNTHYANCLHPTYNSKNEELKKFLVKLSERFAINTTQLSLIANNLNDDYIVKIVENQYKKCSDYINALIISNDGVHTNNFITNLTSSYPIKYKLIKYIFENVNIDMFITLLTKLRLNSINTQIEKIISDYIKDNINKICKNKNLLSKIIKTLSNKIFILKNVYNTIKNTNNDDLVNEIFNNCISNNDKEFIILILEGSSITLDISTITILLSKIYNKTGCSPCADKIAETIDILIDNGLKVTKEIIFKLLESGCYINNIEKYDIAIDNDILQKCAEVSYYPYKFKIAPNIEILKRECSKHDNITTIKKLKELGGIYTIDCLIEAVKLKKNGKVIKYLINECGVEPNDECVTHFQESYGIEALDLIIKNYKKIIINNKSDEINKTDEMNNTNEININLMNKISNYKTNNIELNKDALMNIEPMNIVIDMYKEYNFRSKIKNLLNYKKKSIKYIDLYELFLKYLIDNKLVISTYFIINKELSLLLKLNYCTIISVDQIHNMLTYFIDE